MHVFYTPDIQTNAELPEEEAQHCVRVLRLTAGDEITLTDGKGNFYRAEISAATNKRCLVNIKETIHQEPLWEGHLHIAMAPTKNMDRNEWLAEKATEIGFDELTFLNCRFSERKVIKTERIEKILVSAIKQSLKARLPRLNEMTDFNSFIEKDFSGQKFIAHCYEGEKPLLKDVLKKGEDTLVLIGPEGDFSEEEVKKAIEKGFIPISLGKSRLRTENGGISGLPYNEYVIYRTKYIVIMVKRMISRLSVLGVLIVFMAACSKKAEYIHVIPADASAVASVNLNTLADKAGLNDKENEGMKQNDGSPEKRNECGRLPAIGKDNEGSFPIGYRYQGPRLCVYFQNVHYPRYGCQG